MTIQQLMVYLILFAVLDTIVPVPITAIILIYALTQRPGWFNNLIAVLHKSK